MLTRLARITFVGAVAVVATLLVVPSPAPAASAGRRMAGYNAPDSRVNPAETIITDRSVGGLRYPWSIGSLAAAPVDPAVQRLSNGSVLSTKVDREPVAAPKRSAVAEHTLTIEYRDDLGLFGRLERRLLVNFDGMQERGLAPR
jgi:hypothetical protein